MEAELIVVEGPDPGNRFLLGSHELRAGRSPVAEIRLHDSAAAGETDTDLLGTARRDDTGVCDTGTGARTFDDRGAFEFQGTSSPAVACPSPVTAVPTPTPPTVSSIDFPASIRIADGVFSLAQRAGSPATPWHYDHTAYLDAVTRGLGSPLPPAEARDTPWDPELRQ